MATGSVWPPPWSESEALPPIGDGQIGPVRLPPKDQLDYVQKAITCLLLVLALPYVLMKLFTAPGELIVGLGRKQTRG